MENASKALIIAGAILISIVLITLGVVILGQGQDVVNSSNIDEQVVSTWNQKFTQYVGTKITGANVNALINAVASSNAISNRDGAYNKLITITAGGSGVGTIAVKTGTADNGATYTSGFTTKATPGQTYTVDATTYGQDGYLTAITITVNS
ncbi:MAG: hypothetical protein IKF38_07270 [Clostridia bacterium]|nr:hypothetical protein [Clostridia bacterium]